MSVQPAKELVSVPEFQQMDADGVFPPDRRFELIEGEILELSPVGFPHASTVRRLNHVVMRRLDEDEALVDIQNSVVLDDFSQPQPDVVLLRPEASYYSDRHPGPEDILLLAEVSDSSLAFDRRVKVPLYARQGVPEVWIVNLRDAAVEVYRGPGKDAYSSHEVWTDPVTVLSPELLPQLRLDVRTLVGESS